MPASVYSRVARKRTFSTLSLCSAVENGSFALHLPQKPCNLRQDPVDAILVIFGRRALIFFLFESSWKKMKNDTTFVRMRSGDPLGDTKMSKKGTSLRRI